MPPRNPTRRNRNIGTAKRGHGRNNRLKIPSVGHGRHAFWERISEARQVKRLVSSKELRFFVERTRTDCVYACTVDDIVRFMSYVPVADWQELHAIVLRQPHRKQQTLSAVWGRLDYAMELVDERGRELYTGPAIILEAINPNEPIKFGKSLSIDATAEFERLKSDGHHVRVGSKNNTLESTLESCRATQLYRTLPHELGHWVDFLTKVEYRAGIGASAEEYEQLLERFHARPDREREDFAHSYALKLSQKLYAAAAAPFPRQINRDQVLEDGLRWEDFSL